MDARVRPREALFAAATGLALLTAVVLRVAFLGRKPFWRDEAWIAWLIELPPAMRSAVVHVTPAGFLAAARALAAALPGAPPEIAYRLLPLASGLAAVALMPLLARRLGAGPPAALASLWLAAGLPALVYYARELKSYALDLLWAVAVPLLVLDLCEPERPLTRGARRLRWSSLLLLVAAAPWLSYGALFPIVAIMAWASWRRLRAGDGRARLAMPVAAGVFAAALAAAYAVYLRRQIAHPLLPDIWEDVLPPAHGLPPLAVLHAFLAVHRVSLVYFFPGVWPLAVLLAVVGLFALPAARRGAVLSLLFGAGALASAAALAHLYLVSHGRFLLFLAPPLVVLVSAGLVRVGDASLRRLPHGAGAWIAVTVAAGAALAWGAESLRHRLRPGASRPALFVYDAIQEVEPLVAWLHAASIPPPLVMVGRHAAYPVRYYGRGRLPGAYLLGFHDHAYSPAVKAWLARLGDEGWLLLVDEETSSFRDALAKQGFLIRPMAAARGAEVWRIRRRASPPRTR